MSTDSKWYLAMSAALALSGCGSNEVVTTEEKADVEALRTGEVTEALHNGIGAIALRFSGLEPLGSGYVYEGWVIVDGAPVSAGRFNLSPRPQTLVFVGPATTLAKATTYVLTIEPKEGDDPAPSKVHVLAGDLPANRHVRLATLELEHAAALGDSFDSASGSFLLATPSTETADDDQQGIWFLSPPGPQPSLKLPTLPDGWVYEGWVVTANGPVSTGKFRDVGGADSDGAGPTAGPRPGPPFPGQDFITPPIDLRGTTVVISVEPQPDDSPRPFAIKPLASPIPQDLAVRTPSPIANAGASGKVRGLIGVFLP